MSGASGLRHRRIPSSAVRARALRARHRMPRALRIQSMPRVGTCHLCEAAFKLLSRTEGFAGATLATISTADPCSRSCLPCQLSTVALGLGSAGAAGLQIFSYQDGLLRPEITVAQSASMRRISPYHLLDRLGGFNLCLCIRYAGTMLSWSMSRCRLLLTRHRSTKRLISVGTRPWGLEHLSLSAARCTTWQAQNDVRVVATNEQSRDGK